MAFFTQSKAVRYLLGISGPTILALGLWLLLLATNPGRNENVDVAPDHHIEIAHSLCPRCWRRS
jgi:predicted flavoprotein YhiN